MAVIRLNADESQAFAAALLAEPQQNLALAKAAKHSRRLIGRMSGPRLN